MPGILRPHAPPQRRLGKQSDAAGSPPRFNVVLFHGDSDRLHRLSKEPALRGGPIAALHAFATGETDIPLERLLIERSLSVNTAAAGGNAGLMSIV